MADKDIELKIKARNEAKSEIEEIKDEIKKLGEESNKTNKKIQEGNERTKKTYRKNANTIKDITHNIEILKKQQKSAVVGSKEYTSSIKLLRMEQKKLASATGKMGAQGVEQFNRMRIATAGLRRTLGALRNQILVFLFAWRLIKGSLDIGMEALKVSKDAEEIQNKFDTVFKGIQDVTNDWAESFGDSVGRARQDIKKFSSEIGDVLKPLGFATNEAAALSKQVVELALDVASFNNRQDPEVIQAFLKALSGERESLKTLGIVINEADVKQEAYTAGLARQGEELSKTAKAQATINLLFKNSKDAQGDLARTSDSLVNIEKKRSAEYKNMLERWGKKLIPLAKTWNKLLISMYELTKPAVAKLSELQRTMASFEKEEKQINILITRFQTLKDRTGKSNEEISEMKDLMQRLGEAFPAAATFDEFGNVIDVNIKKLEEYIALQKEALKFELADKMADTFEDFKGYEIDIESKITQKESGQKLIDKYKGWLDELKRTGEDVIYIPTQFAGRPDAKSYKELLETFNDLLETQKEYESSINDTQKPLDVIVKRISSIIDISKDTTPVDLAAELGVSFKKNEVYLTDFLDRWKELQNLPAVVPGGGGEKPSFLNMKAVEDLEKNLKKLYAELGKEQITLGSLDIDEGFERATFVLQKQIATRIEELEDEKQKLTEYYGEKEEWQKEDIAALEKYNEQITALEKIKNTELETLRKQYQEKFEEDYQNAQIDIIRDAMERQIAVLEKNYADDKENWDNALEQKLVTQEQYNIKIIALEMEKNDGIKKLRDKQESDDLKQMQQYYQLRAEMADANLEFEMQLIGIEASDRTQTMFDLYAQELISAQELSDAKIEIMEWEADQRKEILIREFDEANQIWFEPFSAALGSWTNELVESMGITNDTTAAIVNCFANMALEWIKNQIKMMLISDTLKAAEVAKATITGAAIATAYTPAAVAANIASFGGAAIAAGTSHASYLATAMGMALGGLGAAQSGMYVDRERVITVGEKGTKEVIIPVNKFAPFLAGNYLLPGGFGMKNIPGIPRIDRREVAKTSKGGSDVISPSQIYDKDVYNSVSTINEGRKIPNIQKISQTTPVTNIISPAQSYHKDILNSVSRAINEGRKIYNNHFSPENNRNYITKNSSIQNIKLENLERIMGASVNAIREMNMSLLSQERNLNLKIESNLDMEEFIINFNKTKKRMVKRGYIE